MARTPVATGPDWPCLVGSGAGCKLSVHVVPNASHTSVEGLHGGALRIRLAARPVDGAANEALVSWLAGQLELGKRDVRVEHGLTSRRKRVALDLAASHVAQWLSRVAGPAA
jgi:uncharacterized protein (TIGR00251 family)